MQPVFILLEIRIVTKELVAGVINNLLSNGAIGLHHDLVDL